MNGEGRCREMTGKWRETHAKRENRGTEGEIQGMGFEGVSDKGGQCRWTAPDGSKVS